MYTPTNWQDGDIITAAKLNKLEDGLKDADCKVFFVNVEIDDTGITETGTPDMTVSEVMAKVEEGYISIYLLRNNIGGDSISISCCIAHSANTDADDPTYGVAVYDGSKQYAHSSEGFAQVTQPLN